MARIDISKGDTSLSLLTNNLNYEITKGDFTWVGQGRDPHIVFQRKVAGKYRWIYMPFYNALQINHEVVDDAIISVYDGFKVLGKRIDIKFIVEARILDGGKVDFSIEAENEEGVDVKAVSFPQSFNAKQYDGKNSYTVDSMRQGFLLPDTNKKNINKLFFMTKRWRKINTPEASLPLWGRVCDGHGYCGILENSIDASLFSSIGKNFAFLTSVNWLGSLGKLAYKRVCHMHFYDECDYNTFAKEFRAQEIAQGNFVSIDEKIKQNPKVKELVGAPIIQWKIMQKNDKKSKQYADTHIKKIFNYTFAESEEMFKQFKDCGLEKAYINIAGWGRDGYDNLHPYVLPFAEEAGGTEGMQSLNKTCRELGYIFGLEDQYRDYYLKNKEVYDKELAVKNINGKSKVLKNTAGGKHTFLCATAAKQFIERTYSEIEDADINVDGVQLDGFGSSELDECYNVDHTMTREDCMNARANCFNFFREKGVIACADEVGVHTVKYVDLVKHAPYELSKQEKGLQLGVAVPLVNLVYHDSVFVPWNVEGIGGWGIPKNESGKLHCILNGQNPYFNNSMKVMPREDEERVMARISAIKDVCQVNELVYNAEMLKHEFIFDEEVDSKNKFSKQRTTFSNGVVITVNFKDNTYTVEKE